MVVARVEEDQRLTTLAQHREMVRLGEGEFEAGVMTPEAIALTHIDNLDAKIHEFTRQIQDDPNPASHWTPFNARLDRKLFKGSR